jgi:hypothetical protein
MPEVGGEVVEELLQVGVVLLVPLVGVKGSCTSESTARPNEWQRKVVGERPWNGLVRGLRQGGVGDAPCGSEQRGRLESGEGLMMAFHGEQGWRRPWHAVVPLARGQGLGLALGEAEQVRGEARQPGMQKL